MRNATFFLRFRMAETQVLLRAFESALARNGKGTVLNIIRLKNA